MNKPYIQAAPVDVYNCDEDDVYWIVTQDDDGPTAHAMFYDRKDAREYLRLLRTAKPVSPTCNGECSDAVDEERAAVVARLREVAATLNRSGDRCGGRIEALANTFERGEHRREEER